LYHAHDSVVASRESLKISKIEHFSELLQRARAGDKAALEQLLKRCSARLWRWANGRLPASVRTVDTEDLIQETLLHVTEKLNSFEGWTEDTFWAYLRQTFENYIRDAIHR
jgi:RNA polymerase sigma-70 factor (ECF subfamily)